MKIKCELTIPIFAKIVRPYIGNGIKADGKYAEAFFKTFRRDPLDTDVSNDNIKILTPKPDTLRRYINSKGPSKRFAKAILQALDRDKAIDVIDDLYDDQKELIFEKLVKYYPDLCLDKLGEGCADIFKVLMVRYSEDYYKENNQAEEKQKSANTSKVNLQKSNDKFFEEFKSDCDCILKYCKNTDPSVELFLIKALDEIDFIFGKWSDDIRKIRKKENILLIKDIIQTLLDYEALFDFKFVKTISDPHTHIGYVKFANTRDITDDEFSAHIYKANKLRNKLQNLYERLFPMPESIANNVNTAPEQPSTNKQSSIKTEKKGKPMVPLTRSRFDKEAGILYFDNEELHIPPELLKIDDKDIRSDDLPYVNALMDVYSERTNKTVTPKTIDELPPSLKRNFKTQREAYYSTECIHLGVRDIFADGEKQFNLLKKDTYDGVIDTYYDDRLRTGYDRLIGVLNKATDISLTKSQLLNITTLIGNLEKKGICHMLVNDGKIKSWVNIDE